MAESTEEKTEQASDRKMKEVRSKGQLSRSQDLTAWIGMGVAGAVLPWTLSQGAQAATDQVLSWRTVIEKPEPAVALAYLQHALGSVLPTLGMLFAATAVAVIVGSVAQGGLHLKKPRIEVEHLDLLKGMKRIFGPQALWNGVKALLKTSVVGVVLYVVVQSLMPVLLAAGGLPIATLVLAANGGVASLLIWATAAGVALGLLDVLVVAKRNRKKTRMSKKELKDEHKSSDGDPLVKSQRRSMARSMSRNRMIASVADADVVVVNPTHVAVAIKYEPGKSAPRVVAKGADHVAARIRERAEEARVPMVRDIPLARALHQACDVGHEVPVELYTAVARVLAFVMALSRRGAAASAVPHRMAQPAMEPGTVVAERPLRRRARA
ncbi:EscU/YscU/HrcU family type III secretion system export apparatus switch protein [Isoptericola sp. NEAU-Y5]|uniref:EscU/YscU/HrcU family type III secretion system export apparatus switch protein n=1 Tax=Isoptericola luteus TaxID=2879484 RepID=A0ABS7ZKR9_9MICO|nr:EscU/YscU/HrcU family type III secretion system export apparatus switch protein [Isoptericola sp. NEAU-Y5]MCA5895117.1 EscU/YscU/HrcU family type III secretion system export apparatus switch protein [Isoptericola sp. NEAU-Y5]